MKKEFLLHKETYTNIISYIFLEQNVKCLLKNCLQPTKLKSTCQSEISSHLHLKVKKLLNPKIWKYPDRTGTLPWHLSCHLKSSQHAMYWVYSSCSIGNWKMVRRLERERKRDIGSKHFLVAYSEKKSFGAQE